MAETTLTELDKAGMFVQENPDDIHVFYNTFLTSFLYIPTHDIPQKNKEALSPEGKELRPIFTQSGDTLFLMIFDTLERLSAWAQKEVGYVGIEGLALLEMMDPKFHWFLNYGSEHGREFSSNEISWLKSAVQKTSSSTRSLDENSQVLFEAPRDIPKGLVGVLSEVAERNSGVQEATLGQMLLKGKMDQPELALAIRMDGMNDGRRENVLNEFTEAARRIIDDSQEFWILIAGDSSLGDQLLAMVEPFFKR